MRYVFYIACLGLAIYAVTKINGHNYVRQAEHQQIPLNYFQKSSWNDSVAASATYMQHVITRSIATK